MKKQKKRNKNKRILKLKKNLMSTADEQISERETESEQVRKETDWKNRLKLFWKRISSFLFHFYGEIFHSHLKVIKRRPFGLGKSELYRLCFFFCLSHWSVSFSVCLSLPQMIDQRANWITILFCYYLSIICGTYFGRKWFSVWFILCVNW